MSIRFHELFLFLMTFLNLLLSSSCARTTPLSTAPEAMLMEDKIRLGSIPPSCHNRCNACNPCNPVQVPSLPGQGNKLSRSSAEETPFSMYSNYKPLGWKCQCRDQLYNP